MKNYTSQLTSVTPQSKPIPEQRMVPNRAGGWGWEVDDQTRLRRWLMIGTEGPAYYADKPTTARENVTVIDRLLEQDGKAVVDEIVRVSEGGHAPKQLPAIMALAICLKTGDTDTRRYAATMVPRVCRTFDHLASLGEAVQAFGKKGWGRVTKRAIGGWFTSLATDDLAYQLVKYRNRQGWSAKDLLRLSHPEPGDAKRDAILKWAVGKEVNSAELDIRITAFHELQSAEKAEDVVRIVRAQRMPWETVPSKFAKDLDVQATLFETMPMMATVRQLGRLTSLGLLKPGSEHVKTAVARLTNENAIAKSRVHPMQLFLASRTYAAGQGQRGHLSWQPVKEITDALTAAFLASFKTVTPSGRKLVVGVDFSGSMQAEVMNLPGFTASQAAMTMAFVLARTEPNVRFVAFSTYPFAFDLEGVTTLHHLELATRNIAANCDGGTDCAQPILWADNERVEMDAAILLTDEESWAGSIHPIEAVSQYRAKWNRPTRLVSVAFAAHGYSIRGGRDDAGALAVIGFDDACPGIISDFLAQPDPVFQRALTP